MSQPLRIDHALQALRSIAKAAMGSEQMLASAYDPAATVEVLSWFLGNGLSLGWSENRV